jgi:hypothetical protein
VDPYVKPDANNDPTYPDSDNDDGNNNDGDNDNNDGPDEIINSHT